MQSIIVSRSKARAPSSLGRYLLEQQPSEIPSSSQRSNKTRRSSQCKCSASLSSESSKVIVSAFVCHSLMPQKSSVVLPPSRAPSRLSTWRLSLLDGCHTFKMKFARRPSITSAWATRRPSERQLSSVVKLAVTTLPQSSTKTHSSQSTKPLTSIGRPSTWLRMSWPSRSVQLLRQSKKISQKKRRKRENLPLRHRAIIKLLGSKLFTLLSNLRGTLWHKSRPY